MNEDTAILLKECNAGCKTAINSIDQVLPSIMDDELKRLVEYFKEKHVRICESAAILLKEQGKDEKDPSLMARVMTWINTEMKLMSGEENRQIAKLMTNGCNMGIQTLCKAENDYPDAEDNVKRLLHELVSTEEEFAERMKPFL